MAAIRFGVDIGGSKIEVAALLGETETVAVRRRAPTPRGPEDYQAILDTVAALVSEVAAELGRPAPDRIGVGIPGSLSPETGLVRNANTLAMNGRAFDRDLSARLGRLVRLENDANCFALAEALAGAGRGADPVFGVIVGTGVGGGVVVGGRVVSGATRIAGEWGHTPLPRPREEERPGHLCFCGRRGCVETWCCGPALAREHGLRGGSEADGEAIAAAAARGDTRARETLEIHGERLGRALGPVVNILDPEVIVLGGGLSNIAGLAERVLAGLRPHVFSDCLRTRVVRAALGAGAGVIGAAWLWPEA
ncbi:MAG: ROK family protein [Paracoccaceae bacterium]